MNGLRSWAPLAADQPKAIAARVAADDAQLSALSILHAATLAAFGQAHGQRSPPE